jgi:hypothetical protein
MTDQEQQIRQELAVRNAVVAQCHACGLRPLQDSETAILDWFKARGCKLSAERGYLEVAQADGSPVVPSAALETLRSELPKLFVPDPRRDEICCLEDLTGRGTPTEQTRARSQFIAKHGFAAYAALPRTRAEAAFKAVAPSAGMTKKEYLQLSLREKSMLMGIVGPAGIGQIMRRQG